MRTYRLRVPEVIPQHGLDIGDGDGAVVRLKRFVDPPIAIQRRWRRTNLNVHESGTRARSQEVIRMYDDVGFWTHCEHRWGRCFEIDGEALGVSNHVVSRMRPLGSEDLLYGRGKAIVRENTPTDNRPRDPSQAPSICVRNQRVARYPDSVFVEAGPHQDSSLG